MIHKQTYFESCASKRDNDNTLFRLEVPSLGTPETSDNGYCAWKHGNEDGTLKWISDDVMECKYI